MLHVILSRQSFQAWLTAAAALALVVAASTTRASEERRTAQVRAVARAQGSVVNIRGEKTTTSDGGERNLPAPDAGRRVNGMGSGVIIDSRGYVLTNFHVVDGVRKISVTLCDGQSYTARIV